MFFIDFFSNIYLDFTNFNNIMKIIILVLFSYKIVYFLIGIFFTRKFSPAKKKYKYAILIAARNEEKVIGNLIDSIIKQDYPKDLLTTFVVADNCSDQTFKIAREHGAICYERFDDNNKTKGFALKFLLEKIEENYGRMSFDGYFIFDADNLLKEDYISKMNDAFDSGEKIITSYRDTKNFDENWIASTYAIHWLRTIRMGHRARSVLRLATNIQGTGFLFSNEIVKDGWKYTGLTEDRALTVDAVAKGYKITYQDKAIFYDEQPTNLKIALRQRIRWSKGHLLAFYEVGFKLFCNIFLGYKNNNSKRKLDILESIRYRFASFDILMLTFPISLIDIFLCIISIILASCYSYNNELYILDKGLSAWLICFLVTFLMKLGERLISFFQSILEAIYVFIIERNRIKKIPIYKKIIYCFTWPIFDIIGRYTTLIALFKKVEWKPVPHVSKITIEDINKEKNIKKAG